MSVEEEAMAVLAGHDWSWHYDTLESAGPRSKVIWICKGNTLHTVMHVDGYYRNSNRLLEGIEIEAYLPMDQAHHNVQITDEAGETIIIPRVDK